VPMVLGDPACLSVWVGLGSAGAAPGLLLALQHGLTGGQGIGSAASKILETSSIAIAVTAPVIAIHGGSAGPAGLVTNLIAIPWTGLVLLPLSLVSLALVCLPGWVVFDGLLALAAALGRWTLDVIEVAAEWVPDLEASGPPAWPYLVLAAGLGSLTLRSQPLWSRVGLALASSMVLTLAPLRMIAPPPPRLVVLDVGQGDAILVEGREGALLVDAGRALGGDIDLGRSVVLPALRALGVERLELVVASHADLDHRGGLPAVLAGMPVGELWLPPGGERDPAFGELRGVAREMGVAVVERGAGDPVQHAGDLDIEVLWPPHGEPAASRNEGSLVLRVQVSGDSGHATSLLLTGDLGREGERGLLSRGRDIAAHILKVGHHGSRGSSFPSFLDAVGAVLAVVSAPCHGRAGLPSLEALTRIDHAGAKVAWTGRDGALIVALYPQSGSWRANDVERGVRGWGTPRICGGPEWRGHGFD
jgi:competence protein ComEC